MSERREYRIGRVTYIQEEQTWGQTKRLLALISGAVGRLVDDDSLSIKELVPLLTRHDLLGEFMGIALIPRRNGWWVLDRAALLWKWLTFRRRGSLRQVRLEAASNSLVAQIFEDFFFINKPLLKRLTALDGALTYAVKLTEASRKGTSPESSASTPTPTAASSAPPTAK